jgi:prevent-host-death family protein
MILYVRYNVRVNKCITATEARKRFYALIDAAEHPGVSVVITHEGIPKVVVMSFEEFEGWQETMEIMADPDPTLARDIRKGIKEMKTGKRPKGTIGLEALRKQLKL